MDTRWVGTSDKIASLREICAAFDVRPEQVCHIGDGTDDAELFREVGYGVAVADAQTQNGVPDSRKRRPHVRFRIRLLETVVNASDRHRLSGSEHREVRR